MIFCCIGIVLALVYLVLFVIYKIKDEYFRKKYHSCYLEYVKDKYYPVTFSEYIRDKYYVSLPDEPSSCWIVVACTCLVFGLTVLAAFNIINTKAYNTAQTKYEMYQNFVDNASDDLISTCGNTEIIAFNNDVITNRYEQDNWYYRVYHIFDGDWNTVPLVTFKKE